MSLITPFLRRTLPLGLFVVLLAGCAGSPRLVEGNVTSFSTLTALPTPPTYRFERLPSQQAHSALWEPIEAQAQQALSKVGLRHAETDASLIIQIGAARGPLSENTRRNPWTTHYSLYYADPFYNPFGWGWSRWGMGWMMDRPHPLHHRAVTLVMRDAVSKEVVYETSAVHEDIWTDDPAIYGALFAQALSDFPQPPSGPRILSTPLPPK